MAGERVQKLTLPAGPTAKFGLFAEDEQGIAPSPNVFRLSDLGNVLEAEPNADAATATPFEPPMALGGVISQPGDIDCFKFAAKKGQQFDVRVLARGIRSPLDSVMYLGKKGGGAILGSDDSFGPDSYFRFQAPEDAEYVIWVVDQLAKGGPDYFYRIEVTPVVPQLTMATTAELITLGTGVMAIAVPKGNGQAILLYGNRADFGGDLNVGVSGLPAGVSVQAPTIVASQAVVPVLFSAATDAQPGRDPGAGQRQARGCQAQCSLPIRAVVRAGAGPEQRHRLVPDCRSPGGRRRRGMPLLDRDRRAQGAAGPWRLDGTESSPCQAWIQGANRGLPALEPAGCSWEAGS